MKRVNAGISIDISLHMNNMGFQFVLNLARPDGRNVNIKSFREENNNRLASFVVNPFNHQHLLANWKNCHFLHYIP